MDYLDLYLIHWPANELQFGDRAASINTDTWRAMERLVEEKVVRSIGLSNFYPGHMAPVLASANIIPAVDQIEFHPGLLQEETIALCREKGILIEAWSPLGRGHLLEDPLLMETGGKYGKSAAQVLVKWCMQQDILPLVKSVHTERIRENRDVFDFSLTEEEMAAIAALPPFRYGSHPDTATF